MTRRITALFFLGRLLLIAQQPTPTGSPNQAAPPSFTKADMDRLIADFIKVIRTNTKTGTQVLAKRFSANLEKAAKVPPAQRAAAMQKASEDYRKEVDAFNQDGLERTNWAEATSPIVNPMHPEFGYWKNLLDACVEGRRFATRTDEGMPVYRQVRTEGGVTVIHTFTPALPIEETIPSRLSAQAVCLGLVRNAVKASPPNLPEASASSGLPKAMQICVSACATLEWADDHYQVKGRDGKPATTYTVESFTPTSVIIRRTELPHSGDYGLTAVYKGTFVEGATTAQGTVDFAAWPGHSGFPHSGTWKATWGASLAENRPVAQKKPEERGDAEEAQDRSAQDQNAQRFSAGVMGFLAAMLSPGPAGEGGGDGDPSGRIARLQGRLSELSSQCGSNPRDPSGACARARDMRGDLSDAYAALDQEIGTLNAQANQLRKDCSARVAGACAKLNRVRERIESDMELRLSRLF